MAVKKKQVLAEQDDERRVLLLTDNTVRIEWDWLVLHVRQADLLALVELLEDQADQIGWQGERHFTLWLDEMPVHFGWADLLCFRDLLAAARQGLSRRSLRWVDLQVRLERAEKLYENLLFGYN